MAQLDFSRIRSLELAAVMRNGRSFAPAYLVLVCSICFIIGNSVPFSYQIAWALTYLVYIVVRTKATAAYHADPDNGKPERVRRWRHFVAGSACSHGAILGSTAFFALPAMESSRQMALTAIVVCVTFCAAVYVAPLFRAFLALVSIALLSFVAGWWRLDAPLHLLMAQILVMSWAANIYVGWQHSALLSSTWKLIAKNEDLAAELADNNRGLMQTTSSRSRLLAIASHDLRQPVHALGLTIAQLNEYDHPRTLRQHFERLEETSFLVSEMLQELMDLSNLERNEYQLSIQPVQLDPVLEQLRYSQEVIARRKGLRLTLPDTPTGITVRSDAKLLRRVLLNLVSNAVSYTVHGSVTLSCTRVGPEIIIRVTDTGIGIPAQQLDDICRDYVRLDSSGKANDGIGLGLAIVKRAVQVMGHKLKVHSELGVGSVFELSVAEEQVAVASPKEAVAANSNGPAAGEGQSRSGLILIVEDNPYALQALVSLVKKWGYRPVGAAAAADALAQAPPDISPVAVISDLELSIRDTGFEAISLIRKHYGLPDLPAMLLTGDISHEVKVRAASEKIAVAHKPFSPMLLLHEIQALIRHGNL